MPKKTQQQQKKKKKKRKKKHSNKKKKTLTKKQLNWFVRLESCSGWDNFQTISTPSSYSMYPWMSIKWTGCACNRQQHQVCMDDPLRLSTLGKIFSRRHFEIFFLIFFPENRFWHFMQIVSIGDNLHEMSNPVMGKNKKNITDLSSAEYAERVVRIKARLFKYTDNNIHHCLYVPQVPSSIKNPHNNFCLSP